MPIVIANVRSCDWMMRMFFAPMRNSLRTVPVGKRFIWSYSSVTASKKPAWLSNLKGRHKTAELKLDN